MSKIDTGRRHFNQLTFISKLHLESQRQVVDLKPQEMHRLPDIIIKLITQDITKNNTKKKLK